MTEARSEAKIEAASRPTIKQLKRIVIPKVAHKWHSVGLKLLNDDKESLSLYRGRDQKRCSEMLQAWLNRNPNADWYQLVATLESPDVQLNNAAGEIRNMFTGSQATSDSDSSLTDIGILKYCTKAVQCLENNYAEEYGKKSESFYLYPAKIDKPLLRNIEMIGEEQSEKLKRHIEDSLASLSHHLQGKLDKICQHDIKEIFEKHQQQNQQVHVDQIEEEITQLLTQRMEEVLRALQREKDDLIRQFDKAIEKQQAENKRMLTLYKNSQLETNTYICFCNFYNFDCSYTSTCLQSYTLFKLEELMNSKTNNLYDLAIATINLILIAWKL